MSHQGGPGTNQSNQEESEKSWAVSHERSLSGTPVLCCVPVFDWATAPRASLHGQAVSGKFLCFLIKGVTCLAERPLRVTPKFVGWLRNGLLSMVLNGSCAEETCSTRSL